MHEDAGRDADVVVIGSGINSLVATALLAIGGRSVTLVERSAELGGFIASGEIIRPGFVHDLYSSWHPLFTSGGAYRELGERLHSHGLEYANSDEEVCASISPEHRDRGAVIAYRDPVRTTAAFERDEDRDGYAGMLADLDSRGPVLFGALGSELGTRAGIARLAWAAVRGLGLRGTELLARDAASSGRAFLRRRFAGWEVDQLWTPWLLHAGLGPDHATGGVMIPIFAASMHGFGLPVVVGGAAHFVDAFRQIFADHHVAVRTGTEVTRIMLDGPRAVGVQTDAGPIRAGTVVANVSPQELYGRMLPPVKALDTQRGEAGHYRAGRGAMQLHFALDRPVPWEDERLRRVPLVHLTDGAGSTGIACAQAEAGLLPSAPTVVVGQQSILDPTRAPAGQATLWVQLQEVPDRPSGDAAGTIDTSGGWSDEGLRLAYLGRIVDRIERVAPGFAGTILGSEVIAPTDITSRNPNARAGDPYAGAADLDQNLLWRPFPSGARHRTVVGGLWHIGASTHPGPGLGGESGRLAAHQILAGKKS
jgi:phytoene dehydrogenase-like protein